MRKHEFRLPKTKVGLKSFKKIIKAGKYLYGKDGFNSTSINDIISKAKVAAGTFYIYFDSKLALYLYLLDEYGYNIRVTAHEATKDCKTRYDMERAGLKAFIMYVKKDPLAYKLVWESLFVDFNIFKTYYTDFAKSYVHRLSPYVEKMEVRDDINLETVAYVLMGISNFVGLQIVFNEEAEEKDVDYVVDECMKLLKNGIFN
ncbi:MAG: TetR/AcrR family transcriptional regulator [Candidatus Izemoplasmatales bacterium]|nr:TetR/AcrR family transcriptional regulator [Candidatus Izemoplasmatales bacterium]MDD4070503.1 TetR/AcrR family transcriptional regulator [Candidatus Izemoplasmatales bacterium]